jgi:hypothetical protein
MPVGGTPLWSRKKCISIFTLICSLMAQCPLHLTPAGCLQVKKPKTKNKSKLLSAPASRNITHKVSDRLKVSRSERGVRGRVRLWLERCQRAAAGTQERRPSLLSVDTDLKHGSA